MSTRLLFAVMGLLTAAGVTTPMHGAERVSIRVTPTVALAPADVTINAIVEPNAANRLIVVVADSGGYLRRSEEGLDGDSAPRANRFRLSGLPPGEYEIRVTVKGASGQELGSANAQVRVIGEPEHDEVSRDGADGRRP
jgi:hypothetical protein